MLLSVVEAVEAVELVKHLAELELTLDAAAGATTRMLGSVGAGGRRSIRGP